MFVEFFFDVVVQSILVTFFVLCMITLLEYVNVVTQGYVNGFMKKHLSWQVFLSSVLGILPGCLGSYAAVTMYTHDIIGFGALMSNLIATTGDEAFLMFSLMPDKALIIFLVLFGLSVVIGCIINIFSNKKVVKIRNLTHFQLHKTHDTENQKIKGRIADNIKNISPRRLSLIISLLVFIVLILTGFLNEHHDEGEMSAEDNIIKITFTVLSLFSLFVILKVSEHFLEEHIWHHVIGKHFKKVFLWTLAALTVIFLLENIFDFASLIKNYDSKNVEFVMLLIAIAIGLIPESGPHIVFISLYLSGSIPFAVLLANSIVQDGHGTIPLFAENKRDFFVVKGLKTIIAVLIGLALLKM